MKVADHSSDTRSDQQLYALIANGNERAFYDLFEKYWEVLFTISARLLKDKDLAKDVVQEVFTSLWVNRLDKQIENLAGYLKRAVKFASLKELRDNKMLDMETLDVGHDMHIVETDQLEYDETEEAVKKAIEELPERTREVFRMSRFDHLSNKEISEQLGISQRTVETHISNALKQLRDTLPRHLIVLLGIFLTA